MVIMTLNSYTPTIKEGAFKIPEWAASVIKWGGALTGDNGTVSATGEMYVDGDTFSWFVNYIETAGAYTGQIVYFAANPIN